MDETDKKQLYKDALYWHFIGQGYSDWIAKAKAEQMLERQ